MRLQRERAQTVITLASTPALGVGGEARIYAVQQDAALVAKVYHQPTEAHARKLAAMLANPPDDPMASQGHVSIAWPVDLLRTVDGGRRCVGFLMPRIAGMRLIIDFYYPKTRRQHCPLFDYRYLHHTARNLTAAVGALHARGYVIGDVNESNFFVSDGSINPLATLVTLVDTDSFQVRDPQNGVVYRCPVGKPEFTLPELQGKSFAQVDRAPEHDHFGLAVLLFQLLMEGMHPFAGIFTGQGDPPPYEERIRAGHFPYGAARRTPYGPPPIAPPFGILHPTLQGLFVQCFEEGHDRPLARPDAQTWQAALREAEEALMTCPANGQHRYGNHLNSCPWCERAARLGGRDPFPSRQAVQRRQHLQPVASQQTPLPSPGRPTQPPPRPAPTAAPAPTYARPAPWSARLRPLWAHFRQRRAAYLGAIFVLLLVMGLWERNSRVEAPTPGAKTGDQQAEAPAPGGESAAPAPPPASTSSGSIQGRDGAERVPVPAGEFLMGSREGEGEGDEHPQHRVYLEAFYIDKYEVTNARYRKCVEAEKCTPPGGDLQWYNDSQRADHPVVNVDWNQARAYCGWAGGRLPTEAEWEKAARGTEGRVYPWGNDFGSGHANISDGEDGYQETAPVGSFPSGASPYGALDMAGNVWEWVADWYDSGYYARSPSRNPKGPDSEQSRVLRGGSWYYDQDNACAADRYGSGPDDWHDCSGFRCAQDSR